MLNTPILSALRQFRPWLPRGVGPQPTQPTPPGEEVGPAATEVLALSTAAESPAEPAPPTPAQRVIDHLQATGRLGQNDLNRAKRLGEEGTDPLIRMLVRLGLVSERDMAEAMAEVLGLELAEAESFPAEPVASETLSLRFLKDSKVLPLREEEDRFGYLLRWRRARPESFGPVGPWV